MRLLGFWPAATTDPTTPRSAAVAISSDKPLWISFRFISLFCFAFWLGSGNRCWLRDARKPRGMATFAERLFAAHLASAHRRPSRSRLPRVAKRGLYLAM